MIWLRNKDNNNIYKIEAESAEYAYLRSVNSSVDNRPLFEELGLQEVTADQPSLPYSNFVLAKYVGAVTTAADDQNTSMGLAPADGTLLAVVVVTKTAVAGQATNFRTLTLFDDGSPANAGASYAQVNAVSMAAEAFSSAGATLATGQENSLTISSASVNCNDILRFASIHSGTGLAFPDYVVLATFSRKA